MENDSFQFRITLRDMPLTRRGVLSTIGSVYDPLGFIAPVILKGKKILEQLCLYNSDWDAPVSDRISAQRESWKTSLFLFESLLIKRCLKHDNFGDVCYVELHHFSDASTIWNAQCSYVRLTDNYGSVHCSFMMGKARVMPIKPVTIPRLELTAALYKQDATK